MRNATEFYSKVVRADNVSIRGSLALSGDVLLAQFGIGFPKNHGCSKARQAHPESSRTLRVATQRRPFSIGQVFNDTTNSYKLFWFLGLLSLIKTTTGPGIEIGRCLHRKWPWQRGILCVSSDSHSDCRINSKEAIRGDSGCRPACLRTPSPRPFAASSKDSPAARARLDYFKRYVPTRFLTSWFQG